MCRLWGAATPEAAPWLRVGVAELRLGRPEQAREAFARAARCADASPRVALGAAEAALHLGRASEAHALLAQVPEGSPFEGKRTALLHLADRLRRSKGRARDRHGAGQVGLPRVGPSALESGRRPTESTR